jgi:hypothetical protein
LGAGVIGILGWFWARPARLLGAGAVIAIGILFVQNQLLERARDRAERRAREERLERTNLEARMDTTRQLFQDSLRGVTRWAEQLQVQSHARLQARDREAAVRADIELRFDSVLTVIHSRTTEDAAGVRTAELAIDSMPLHVRVSVAVPPPPGVTRWDVAAWLDPARFTLELACEKDRARADLVSPSWLDLRLLQVQQDPRVCAPPVHTSAKARRLAIGAGVGLGVIRNGSGWQAGPGGFVGLMVRF